MNTQIWYLPLILSKREARKKKWETENSLCPNYLSFCKPLFPWILTLQTLCSQNHKGLCFCFVWFGIILEHSLAHQNKSMSNIYEANQELAFLRSPRVLVLPRWSLSQQPLATMPCGEWLKPPSLCSGQAVRPKSLLTVIKNGVDSH